LKRNKITKGSVSGSDLTQKVEMKTSWNGVRYYITVDRL